MIHPGSLLSRNPPQLNFTLTGLSAFAIVSAPSSSLSPIVESSTHSQSLGKVPRRDINPIGILKGCALFSLRRRLSSDATGPMEARGFFDENISRIWRSGIWNVLLTRPATILWFTRLSMALVPPRKRERNLEKFDLLRSLEGLRNWDADG